MATTRNQDGHKPEPRAKKEPPLAAPAPSSATYPYLHLGHGVSAARKSWGMVVVLREPLASGLPRAAPLPLSAVSAREGSRVMTLFHHDDSLQWVVAGCYRVDEEDDPPEQATGEQWKAFNDDIDDFLSRLHERNAIAAVIRPIDDEYSTVTSPWHDWSCVELPRFLPFLDSLLTGKQGRWFVEHACDLWREHTASLPVAAQQTKIDSLADEARAVFVRCGGAPQVQAPPPPQGEPPTLAEQVDAWNAMAPEAEVFAAFAAANSRPERGWGLSQFMWILHDGLPAQAALLAEVVQRALASPKCTFPETHWRPYLVEALVQLGRLDAARAELPAVAAHATSYLTSNWRALFACLDADGRREDADTLFRAAKRYSVGFDLKRKVNKAPDREQDKQRAAVLMLDLMQPLFADMGSGSVSDELLREAAFRLEDMARKGAISNAVQDEAMRARSEVQARKEVRLAQAQRRLEAGDVLDHAALADLLAEYGAKPDQLSVAHAGRIATAAAQDASQVVALEQFVSAARTRSPPAALVACRAIMSVPAPSAEFDKGEARKSWLRLANLALIDTHAQKLFDESARFADLVIPYIRENKYLPHSVACSYVAVKRFDDAMAYARLAIELDYPHLDQMRVDADLGALLERDDFKALFAGKPT